MCYRIPGQQTAFLGKKELAANPLAKKVLEDLGLIAVDRHHSDMEAMRACMRALREGRILGIFPEGTRHHKGLMDQLEGGTALLALRCNVPLVPVYFDKKFRLFRLVHMYVGQDIPLDDLIAQGVNKGTCDQLLQRITGSMPPWQQRRPEQLRGKIAIPRLRLCRPARSAPAWCEKVAAAPFFPLTVKKSFSVLQEIAAL